MTETVQSATADEVEPTVSPLPSGREYIAGMNRHFAKVCGTVIAYSEDDLRTYAAQEVAAEREAMAFDQCYKMSLLAEIERLQASRSAEGDRLDWLLCKLPGNVLRNLVGELSDTSDVAEWRAAIDRAAGFLPPNAR